jgi:type IV secretion system protein VirB4
MNLPQAWFGSLPAVVHADVRTPVMMSLNLCDLIPAHSVWTGPRWNKHLDGPVLFMGKTQGSTPFRFSNFYQDVANLAVIGPTGSGKTTLLNLLAASYRRYPNSQVFIFDKGAGSRALTLAVGGEFYDLGAGLGLASDGDDANAVNRGVAFQPLGAVDDESERRWALGWLLDVVKQENVEVTTQVKEAVRSALEVLARNERKQRTMSVLVGLLQHREAKEALRQYTLAGAYGRFFDADEDQLGQNDWQTFETEQLLGIKAIVVPVLMYLFHRLEQRFRHGRPTLLVLDEVWSVLLISIFAAKFREWLKVLRKKNVAVVFATQSLSDLIDSPAASAVVAGTPTRVFLANPKATDPLARHAYEAFGLNDQQIDLVAKATPKRHYYFQSPEGNRLFELGLGDVELAFFAAGSAQDQQLIDRILRDHSCERFAEHLLRAKGLDATADRLVASIKDESEVKP